jgi:transglutaminase-like putative cysteine protease
VLGLQDYVELPPGFNPRTLAWAAELRRDPAYARAGARELVQYVMRHIRTGGYSYTLAPGEYGRDAVDEFWLDRKEGFCEHFAAAFVVVMRALDVPARVVTGYQGADSLPADGYFVVRQSAAHAWAEYWQAGVGWVRADPTAAVAPDRISRSLRLVPSPGLVAGALNGVSPELLAGLRDAWESLNNRWNQSVLNYSRGQQFDVLKELGFESPDWQDLAKLMIVSLSTLALAGATWAWWDRHRVDPWTRQREALLRTLRRLGVSAAVQDAPGTLAQRVRERLGGAGEPLAALLDTLQAQRYGREARRHPDASLTRSFAAAARGLRPAADR